MSGGYQVDIIPYSLLLTPYSLFLIPYSLLIIILKKVVQYTQPVAKAVFQVLSHPIGSRLQIVAGDRFHTSVKQLHYHFVQPIVQVYQIFRFPLIEWAKILLEIIEIRCSAIGTYERNPMLVLPSCLVTYLHIARQLFAFCFLHRHGQRQMSVGRGDGATIAIGLFRKTLHHLYSHPLRVLQISTIPIYGTEIGSGQNQIIALHSFQSYSNGYVL